MRIVHWIRIGPCACVCYFRQAILSFFSCLSYWRRFFFSWYHFLYFISSTDAEESKKEKNPLNDRAHKLLPNVFQRAVCSYTPILVFHRRKKRSIYLTNTRERTIWNVVSGMTTDVSEKHTNQPLTVPNTPWSYARAHQTTNYSQNCFICEWLNWLYIHDLHGRWQIMIITKGSKEGEVKKWNCLIIVIGQFDDQNKLLVIIT